MAKKRKKSAESNPAKKSGTAKKRAKSRAPARAANPTKKRAKSRRSNPTKKRAKSRRSNPTKKRAKSRRSNPAKEMAGKGPSLHHITPAKARRKARGMKKVSTRTNYKSRNKRGPKKHYTIEKRYPNPIGGGWKALALCGVGTLIGYEAADVADRFVAGMAPSNAPYRWYGSDAAHRQMQRPTLMRVGAQLGVAALFFGGAVLAAKKYPMVAAGLGGGFIGAIVHVGHQQMATRVWPALFAAEKGTERNWGTALWPIEQAKLQDVQDKALAEQDKAVTDAKTPADMPFGMTDGPVKGDLPDAYKYPTELHYTSTNAALAQRRRLAGTAALGQARELASPAARIREVDLRQQQTRQAEPEPRARPRDTSAPQAAPRTVAGAPEDRSNQVCTDKNGQQSVTDQAGRCIEMIGGPRTVAGNEPTDAPPPPASTIGSIPGL